MYTYTLYPLLSSHNDKFSSLRSSLGGKVTHAEYEVTCEIALSVSLCLPLSLYVCLSVCLPETCRMKPQVSKPHNNNKQQARTGKSEGTLDLWSWESSAKKWYERPDWQITALKGCVYRVNRRGPITEPCGTPHFRTDGVDSWSTNTDWVQQLK